MQPTQAARRTLSNVQVKPWSASPMRCRGVASTPSMKALHPSGCATPDRAVVVRVPGSRQQRAAITRVYDQSTLLAAACLHRITHGVYIYKHLLHSRDRPPSCFLSSCCQLAGVHGCERGKSEGLRALLLHTR